MLTDPAPFAESRFEKGVFYTWLGFLVLFALRPIEDPDTFWQLQSGRYMWETGKVIYRDTFSLAAHVPRVEHCWLSDLVFYALYRIGGYPLLALLKPAAVTVCGALLFRWNLRKGLNAGLFAPVLLLCFVASADSWLVRPQLWTFVFALLYIHLLFRGRDAGWRALRWLPVIMVAWANLHAGCLFGLALIALFAAGEVILFLRGKIPAVRLGRTFAAGLLALGATFVNPYGFRIPLMLLDYVNLHAVTDITKLGNMEWLPPTFSQAPLFYIIMVLWGISLLPRFRERDPAELVLYLAFAYMGFSQIRHATLVSLLAGYFLPSSLAFAFGTFHHLRRSRFIDRVLVPGLTVLVAAGLLVSEVRQQTIGFGLKRSAYPVAAADFLLERKLPGNLFNFYDWGGYLMWRLYPQYQVFVDGRSTSVEMFEAFTRVANGMEGWSKTLDDYGVNTVITRSCFFDTGGPVPLVDHLARDPRWALLFARDNSLIFIRRDPRFSHLLQNALPSHNAYLVTVEEAQGLYREDRGRSRALLAMARASFRLGDYEKAHGYYSRFLETSPENLEARKMMEKLKDASGHPSK